MDPSPFEVDARRFNEFLQLVYYPDIALNILLVLHRVRRAFLLQWIDYGEYSFSEPKTQGIVTSIKKVFPEIAGKQIDQGFLLSLDRVTLSMLPMNPNDIELGTILSYPYPGDIFSHRDYSVQYNFSFDDNEYNILGCICRDTNNNVQQLSKSIEQFILLLNEHLEKWISFSMKSTQMFTLDSIIEAVQNNRVNSAIIDETYNYFDNFDMGLLSVLNYKSRFDIFQPDFRSFLLTLLLLMKAEDPLENELFMISNEQERSAVHRALFNKRTTWLRKVLDVQFSIRVEDQDVQEAYNDAFH